MALTDILSTIEKDAAREVSLIAAQTKKELADILESSNSKLAEQKKLEEEKIEATVAKSSERILSKAHHEVQFMDEAVKVQRVTMIIEYIKDTLGTMPSSDYESYLTRAVKQLPEKSSTYNFVVGESKADATTKILTGLGVEASKISASKTRAALGGFIAESKKVDYDFSFEAMIEAEKKNITLVVSNALYKKS